MNKNLQLLAAIILLFVLACTKDDKYNPASLSHYFKVKVAYTEKVTQTAAIVTVEISTDGAVGVTEKGLCWSTLSPAGMENNRSCRGVGVSSFVDTVLHLKTSTKYYVRAYCMTSKGVVYSEEVEIKTLAAPSMGVVEDIDGNKYKTVYIGKQQWMAENLRTTRFLNGDTISTTNPTNKSIASQEWPEYQWQNFNDSVELGRLYTWHVARDNRNICPRGWHVSTDEDWKKLERFIGMKESETNQVGERGSELGLYLKIENFSASATLALEVNKTGFSAQAAGYRDLYGNTLIAGYIGSWWTATDSSTSEAILRQLRFSSNGIFRGVANKSDGFSVRCVKTE